METCYRFWLCFYSRLPFEMGKICKNWYCAALLWKRKAEKSWGFKKRHQDFLGDATSGDILQFLILFLFKSPLWNEENRKNWYPTVLLWKRTSKESWGFKERHQDFVGGATNGDMLQFLILFLFKAPLWNEENRKNWYRAALLWKRTSKESWGFKKRHQDFGGGATNGEVLQFQLCFYSSLPFETGKT